MTGLQARPATDLDGVELKLNFDATRIDDALRAFGLDAGAAKARRIWFGEVLDGRDGPAALPLSARGVILRVRAKGNGGDVTLKLRGPDGTVDVRAWREGPGTGDDAKIEGDWAGRRLVSASLGHDLDRTAVDELDRARPPVEGLLSAQQRDLAAALLIPVEHVRLLGPITARKWDPEGDSGVAAELWEVDDLRFLEISVLVTDDPTGALERLRQRATEAGLDLAAGQETKTATVLRHLAARPA